MQVCGDYPKLMPVKDVCSVDPAGQLDSLLAGIRQTFEVDFEPLAVDGEELRILDIKNMESHLDRLLAKGAVQSPLRDLPLWAKLWPGSIILGRFLRHFEPQGKTLLELGCGMAGLSLVAARHGFDHILATDMEPAAINFAKANILANNLQDRIEARLLDICSAGSFAGQFDLVAASELLYLDSLHRPLLKFIRKRLAPGGKALFCTDLARLKPRFQKLASDDFNIAERRIAMSGAEKRVYSILVLERK